MCQVCPFLAGTRHTYRYRYDPYKAVNLETVVYVAAVSTAACVKRAKDSSCPKTNIMSKTEGVTARPARAARKGPKAISVPTNST